MPWIVIKKGSKHCVQNKDTGKVEPGGCHETQKDAVAHQRALYASTDYKGK